MNFLQRWLSRALPPGPPLTWDYFMANRPEAMSGIYVSEQSSLDHSPVWSGVFQLAGDVAKLPLSHNRILTNGGKEIFQGKLHSMLHDRTNPEMTAFKFRECMQALCVLYGNAYAEILRDGAGRPVWMYPIAPTRVTPIREPGTVNGLPNPRAGRLVYRIDQPSGGQALVSPENMVHISSLSTDGVIGHNVTDHARESIALGLAAEKFGAAFFGNGATFGGVVEVQQTLQGPQGEAVKANIRSAIEAVHAGVERAHKILVLAGGAKFTERGTPPDNAQFIETRKFQIQEVSRWLVMPPHKLGDLENAHFTNIEESELQYWKGTVHRWLKMWEQELRVKLIPPLEQNLQSIDFNMEGELRGTSAQRAAFYKEMVGLGAYTINTVLEKEGLPTIGPAGDMHLVPLNMIPIERYGEYIDATIAKLEAPPPQPQLPAKDEPDEDAERVLKAMEETRATTQQLVERVTAKLEQEVQAHAAEAEASRAAKTASERAAAEAEAAKAEAERVAAEAERDRTEAKIAFQEATLQLEAAKMAQVASAAEAAEKQARIDAALADVATKTAALLDADRVATEQTALSQAAQVKAEQAEQEAQARAAEVVEVRAALEAAETARAEYEQRAQAAAAAHADAQVAERARMARFVTAYRGLIAEAIRRVATFEVERMRKRSQSPDRLKQWAVAFYDEARMDECTDRFFPYAHALATLKGDETDARAMARAMATEYCQESVRQITRLTDGMDGAEFQTEVTKLLNRWELERPQAVADRVVRDEIAALVSR